MQGLRILAGLRWYMKPVDRQKICSNCDAQISFESSECAYCGASIPKAALPNPSFSSPFNKTLQDGSASLYPPPYAKKSAPTITPSSPEPKNYLNEAVEKKAPLPSENAQEEKIWPVFSFAIGSTLLTLGLILFFFSDDGKLHLEWDSSFWYIYCLIALPLVILGLRKLKKADSNQKSFDK